MKLRKANLKIIKKDVGICGRAWVGWRLNAFFQEATLKVGELMLTKELDRETEQLLAEILEQENTTSDELIKNLIRDRWLSLNQQSAEPSLHLPEIVEQELMSNLGQAPAKQKNSKQTIAEFIRRKRYR